MYVNGEAIASRLRMVGHQLDAAARELDDAGSIDAGHRFRPWGLRGKVHARLDAAHAQLQLAATGLQHVDGGFTQALEAVRALATGATRESLGNLGPARNPGSYRRGRIRELRDLARTWAEVTREGARLVEAPAASRATHRNAVVELAKDIGAFDHVPTRELRILAAFDELPLELRPDLPHPIARHAVHAVADFDTHVGETMTSLGSWARRERILAQPGIDRARVVELLARALEEPDPREALRTVAAIDQLPGTLRPDLPHVANDWNWTTVQAPRNPGRHEEAVAALRARLDDIRASVDLPAAPDDTLDAVRTAVARPGRDSLLALRGMPGFPASLVAEASTPSAFDLVRIRVWLDAQLLARRPDASRQAMVDELHRALAALEPGDPHAGRSAGAVLADRLEGRTLTGHHALIRIAAIDMLPASLRPELPDLVGIGSRIDAAAHQSPHAFDHRRDLLRLRAWAAQQPRTSAADAAIDAGERSALRRFLDPSEGDDAADTLTRSEQSRLLADVLGDASMYKPFELNAALAAASRHLADTHAFDDQLRPLVAQARELVDRNLAYIEGLANPGYGQHPDYAELGRVAQAIKLVDAFEGLASNAPGTLAW